MISLEQIKKLESRVARAVELIETLRNENTSLKSRLEDYRDRIGEMEILIGKFKEDQSAIEHGVLSALEQLDRLEDGLLPEDTAATAESTPHLSENAVESADKREAPSAGVSVKPDSELEIF